MSPAPRPTAITWLPAPGSLWIAHDDSIWRVGDDGVAHAPAMEPQVFESLVEQRGPLRPLAIIPGVEAGEEALPTAIEPSHIEHAITWSTKTFGPGERTASIVAHARKELAEIEQDPHDLSEWVDLILLGFDGAWRHGHTPTEIIRGIHAKWRKNRRRQWPDWRTVPDGEPVEHVDGIED